MLTHFRFTEPLAMLETTNLLWGVIGNFASIDLNDNEPKKTDIGFIFKNLRYRYTSNNEQAAGDFKMPRNVTRVIARTIFAGGDNGLHGRTGTGIT